MQLANVGSRVKVMRGKASKTANGLTANNLTRNSKGRIVTKASLKSKMTKRKSMMMKKTAHRPVTRSMTAATKAKRTAALVKARAARGTKKVLSVIKEVNSKKSMSKSKGGFFTW